LSQKVLLALEALIALWNKNDILKNTPWVQNKAPRKFIIVDMNLKPKNPS